MQSSQAFLLSFFQSCETNSGMESLGYTCSRKSHVLPRITIFYLILYAHIGTASDWSVEQGSRSGLLTTHHPHLAVELHANGPVQYDYADSAESDSAEKPSYSSLEGSEESPSQVSNAHSSPTTKYATFV